MATEKDKTSQYVWGGVAVLCLLILLGWLAFRQSSSPPERLPAKVEAPKPHARREAPEFETTGDSTQKEMTGQTNASATTNAADLYRRAFALYDALTNDEKNILSDWRTNVDAAVESELCEKIRPICDLMHQASAVTNCDWGLEPIMLETKLPHIKRAREVSRAALWNAAHCRSNDVAGATDDALSILQLGHNVSQTLRIGCLMDITLQGLTLSYIAQNVGLFSDADNERLAVAFRNAAYEEAPGRAMEQEADFVDRFAVKLASLPDTEMKKELADLQFIDAPELNRAAALAALKQVAESERELAKAMTSSSEDEYEGWHHTWTELMQSNPLAPAFLGSDDLFVDKVRYAELNRALVVAGLAVGQGGTDALQAHLDPSNGQPFVYTETPDGFELQSSHQVNGKPMTMQFK